MGLFSFFNKKQKKIALNKSQDGLYDEYEKSEKLLQDSAQIGDEKLLHSAMSHHHDLEYAMLYQNTPQYKRLSEQGIKPKSYINFNKHK